MAVKMGTEQAIYNVGRFIGREAEKAERYAAEYRKIDAEKLDETGRRTLIEAAILADLAEQWEKQGTRELTHPPTLLTCYCGCPLVSTIVFSQAELYCLDCGRAWAGFLTTAKSVETTQRLADKYEKVEKEWREHAQGILTGHVMRSDCPVCTETKSDHLSHCTPAEKEIHEAALLWLAERAGCAVEEVGRVG